MDSAKSYLGCVKRTPFINQLFATIFSGLFQVGYISVWSMTSTVLPQITVDPNSPVYLTNEEASWFGSLPMLVAIPGSIIGGILGERLGPRRCQLILVPFLIASHIMMLAASWEVVHLTGATQLLILSSRVVQGTLIALLNPSATFYPCEISDAGHRGTFSGLLDVWASLGFFVCYGFGYFLPWYTSVWVIPLVTLVPAYIGFLLISPESPAWLLRHGRDEEALKILSKIRGSEDEINEEVWGIKSKLKLNEDIPLYKKLKVLCNKPYIIALLVSCFTVVMKEMNGHFGITLYTVQIFQSSGTALDPFLCSIIIGLTRLVFCSVSSVIMPIVSRRTLLIIGNSIGAIATTSIGVFFYLMSTGIDTSSIHWIPGSGLFLFMMAYAMSVGPVCWTVATEVLPGPIRSIGSGMDLASWGIATFIVSKFFLTIKDEFGMHSLFFIFAFGCLVFILFAYFIVPETKGLTLYDIEKYWDTKYGNNNNNTETNINAPLHLQDTDKKIDFQLYI